MTGNTQIEAAKASVTAYGNKDWSGLREVVAPGFQYDEVGTGRVFNGIENVIVAYKAWAKALPDSKATIDKAFESGNTVVLELTWRGHQSGPLQIPNGTLPPSGNAIKLRACQIVEMEGGKAKTVHHYFDMATLLGQVRSTAGITA